MLLHSAVTNTKDIVPSTVPGATDPWALSRSLVAWLTVVLLWAAAGYFLFDAPETIASPASSSSLLLREGPAPAVSCTIRPATRLPWHPHDGISHSSALDLSPLSATVRQPQPDPRVRTL
jgi:hypothetical protein